MAIRAMQSGWPAPATQAATKRLQKRAIWTSRRRVNGGNTAFHQKYMEIGGHRRSAKLAQHQGDLTAMIRGMVGQMLHQPCQVDLRRAKRNHRLKRLVGHATHKLNLLFPDF